MTGMNRRTLLAALALLPAANLALPAQAALTLTDRDRADIARMETYLTGLHSLKARFLQVAPNGSISEGVVWLDRPGKMRFQYDPPSPFLLVANYGLVVFNDRKLQQTSNIPLSQTPLGIILADKVKLSGDVEIIGLRRQPGEIILTLQRTASQSDGSITLFFADQPLALQQWTVVDQQRQETSVKLFNVELGGKFDPALFKVATPTLPPAGGGG
jgi:outer membrane lipoprotein-sorting protein